MSTLAHSQQEATQRHQKAQEVSGRLQAQLQAMRAQLKDAAEHCHGWAERHVFFVSRYQEPVVATLAVPSAELFSSLCQQPLGESPRHSDASPD